MKRTKSDWGLPDWRDPSAYGDVKKWSELRWRWEFTRRRDDIRAAFLKHAEATRKLMLETPEFANREPEPGELPTDPGFWAMTPDQPKFGMVGIPNPAISDQPMLEGLFEGTRQRAQLGRGIATEDPDTWRSIGLLRGQVAIVFDLDKPLNLQLNAAKATLRSALEHSGIKPIPRRKRPMTWFKFLRVLDAREEGASWDMIATDVIGVRKQRQPNGPQVASATWKQACRLRDNWPATNLIPAKFDNP